MMVGNLPNTAGHRKNTSNGGYILTSFSFRA